MMSDAVAAMPVDTEVSCGAFALSLRALIALAPDQADVRTSHDSSYDNRDNSCTEQDDVRVGFAACDPVVDGQRVTNQATNYGGN